LQKKKNWADWLLTRTSQANKTKPDYDPNKVTNLSQSACKELMKKSLPDILHSSLLQQNMFFSYLYAQFTTLATSCCLSNVLVVDHPIQYKHKATKCIIDIAKDLCLHSYDHITTGEKDIEFFLCKKWKKSKKFLYLINQDGSLSILASSAEGSNLEKIEFLEKHFFVITWKDQVNKKNVMLFYGFKLFQFY
ncbi:hypothetical protein RFI_22732, partial [Reticulomyxa filosa]